MSRLHRYQPAGVCTRHITIRYTDEFIEEVLFEGGCHGNTQGISALVRGMKIGDAAARLERIDCKGKGTSCPDQLARGLKEILKIKQTDTNEED